MKITKTTTNGDAVTEIEDNLGRVERALWTAHCSITKRNGKLRASYWITRGGIPGNFNEGGEAIQKPREVAADFRVRAVYEFGRYSQRMYRRMLAASRKVEGEHKAVTR